MIMEENKFYGPKPSYVFMKVQMKEDNNTSFYYHGMNLVYYCIKHDFNEEQVKEYLDKEIQKCKKYLETGKVNIYNAIPYHFYKDIINTSKDDFKLRLNRSYKYDWNTHKYTDEIEEYHRYEWINKFIKYESPENRYRTFFRQDSEHAQFLNDLFKRRGYCQCEIYLDKRYYKDKPNEVVIVFNHYCSDNKEKEFKDLCLKYWHFIKLLDCVSENEKNDIDIDDLYSRKEAYDKLYDRTKIQVVKHHTKETNKENIFTKLTKIFK